MAKRASRKSASRSGRWRRPNEVRQNAGQESVAKKKDAAGKAKKVKAKAEAVKKTAPKPRP